MSSPVVLHKKVDSDDEQGGGLPPTKERSDSSDEMNLTLHSNNNNNNNNDNAAIIGLPSPESSEDEKEGHDDSPSIPIPPVALDAPPAMDLKDGMSPKSNAEVAKAEHFRRVFTPKSGVIESKLRTFSSENPIELATTMLTNTNTADQNPTLTSVDFTHMLRQVDVGIETMEQVKEVIRKFGKHQLQDSVKLLDVLQRYPSNYRNMDGMREFAECCDLTQQLITETTRAQRRLAEFLNTKVVPTMNKYIQDKQQKVQQMKRQNQQAEMKLNSTISAMKKHAQASRTAARKAKQVDASQRPNRKNADAKKKTGWMSKVTKRLGGENKDMTEEEALYLKAQQEDEAYKASVMTANHEQGVYVEFQQKFKKDCYEIEIDRMNFCVEQVKTFVVHHKQMFSNQTVLTLETQLESALNALNSKKELDIFLKNTLEAKGPEKRPANFVYESPDFQNSFYSLKDAMHLTKKLEANATVPKIMTSLCQKVIELDGFRTEGIFRISAATSDLQTLREELMNNNYAVQTKDPHVPAGMLKEWLRGLNDSLIPGTHYDICVAMAKEKQKLDNDTLDVFLSQLPEENRESIRYLVSFLKKLLKPECVDVTRMNLENVAIVFAPTILKCPIDDPTLLMQNNKFEKDFVIQLITNLAV